MRRRWTTWPADAGVLAGPLLQALAQSPAAARTTSRLVTVLAFLMGRML